MWGYDDTILVATASLATGLQRVSAFGGTPEVLTRPNRERGRPITWPHYLPGSRAALFTITAATGGIEAGRRSRRDNRHLEESHPQR